MDPGKAERLFRAVVSAFCSLTRPSRREIAQLEDLTLPLFDSVSPESLRFAAAALSECEYAPTELVRRICEAPVDIAAPLLIRSRALADIDLIALIGRHGLPHARAIARRKGLNQTIANLIKALERPMLVSSGPSTKKIEPSLEKPEAVPIIVTEARVPGRAAEDARRRLRSMMLADRGKEAATINLSSGSPAYVKLRETALTGNAAFFRTALADVLEIDFAATQCVTAGSDYSSLLTALRAIGLGEDKAFLIAVAVFPMHFPHPQAIRLFLDRYRLLHHDVALDRVRGWKTETLSRAIRHTERATANSDTPPEASKNKIALKAS